MLLIVTRPLAQATAWVHQLQALGTRAQALPLIEIAPVADTAAVIGAWQGLGASDLAMFVSANAVTQFFALRPAALAWPEATLAAATGPGTSAALRAAGVPAHQIVEPPASEGAFDSEALWLRLRHRDWQGRRARIVRGEDGRNWLADQLQARGAMVEFVAAYRRLPPLLDSAATALLQHALEQPQSHLWLFSSSQAVAHLGALAPGADWSRSHALASHPRIAQAARALGLVQVGDVAPDPAAVAQRAAAWPSIQSAAQ